MGGGKNSADEVDKRQQMGVRLDGLEGNKKKGEEEEEGREGGLDATKDRRKKGRNHSGSSYIWGYSIYTLLKFPVDVLTLCIQGPS